ncbi:MAG: phosphatase PAP2 family protein [Acidimicrobiia bacterium]|nr:phosphatase PAP2 family protein [Acidimicrobiia bacterium]
MRATASQRAEPETIAVARPSRAGRATDLLLNVGLLALAWIAYSTIRGVTADEFGTAMRNASELRHFQEAIGLPNELLVQRFLLGRTALIKAANVYYIAFHFPVTIGFMSWVWLRHRDRFDRIRNTLIGVSAVGLLVHVVYPLAPPRMVFGFVDTGAVFGPSPYNTKISSAANQIAAMPSLHVGWALLVAIGVIWILRSRWRWLALSHPAITTAVVILTANHYWVDGIVAALLVLVAWFVFAQVSQLRKLGYGLLLGPAAVTRRRRTRAERGTSSGPTMATSDRRYTTGRSATG